jgi:septal ring-binding cell division protein DamX
VMMSNGPAPTDAAALAANGVPVFSALLSDALDPKSATAPKTAGELRDALVAFVLAERSNRPATVTLGVSLSASIPQAEPRRSTAPAALAKGASERPDLLALALERLAEALLSARARLMRLGPWAREHRLALSLAAALVLGGLTLGNLLGQLRGAPLPDPPAASAAASAATAAAKTAATLAQTPPSTAAPASGTVVFRIEPWGEILIDNKPTGVSPPMIQVSLPSGPHQIEVRHGDSAPWVEQINVEAAVPVTVSHRFE